MIISGQQVVDELTPKALLIVGPWDVSYFAPHKAWLDKYAFWWKTEILPTLNYEPEEYDCDDFSLRCLVEVKKSILETGIKGATPAFFVARISVNTATSFFGPVTGDHVTNLCRCDDTWYFFEPQNCQIATLDDILRDAAVDIKFVLV